MDFDEFLSMMTRRTEVHFINRQSKFAKLQRLSFLQILKENQTEDELREAFRLLDKNEDGFISIEELE